jgi:hypothetical protein
MSSWNTPSGSIGEYTCGQSLTFTFSASPTLGGSILYVLSNNTPLPSGLTLAQTTGVLSGTPAYVGTNSLFNFDVSATEYTLSGATQNIQSFSIEITTLTWSTPAGSIGVFADQSAISYQFVATPSQPGNTVTYAQLNGQLPTGTVSPVTINSSTGLLSGTPDAINSSTTYEFTIRATEYAGSTVVGFRDRTFTLEIEIGNPIPVFVTPAGSLFTTNDSSWQSFQIQYINPNITFPVVIDIAIGQLPPGLEISPDGLIRGYALPPKDSAGSPINKTYTFTLQIYSSAGRTLSQYSITVNNQQLIAGFVGRAPNVLNTQPPSFLIPADDPYAPYYLSSTDLGNYFQNTEFIFKIIGYNFDTEDANDLTYVINGPSGTTITSDLAGWMSGVLPTIGQDVQVYNFTVSVQKTSNPALTSDTFFMSFTLIGDVDTQLTWVSDSDLGTINNGEISDISVLASGGSDISYRIVGNDIQSNLTTIVSTGTQFNAFGDIGAFVTGTANGQSWTQQSSITSPVSFLYFTASYYDPVAQTTLLVGYDQTNSSIIGQVPDSTLAYIPSATVTPNPLRRILLNSGTYVAVGDSGTITTTTNFSTWTTVAVSGTTQNLNGICYGNGRYVVVGEGGTILTSTDAVTWTLRPIQFTLGLTSVIWTGTRYVAVGNLGLILTSVDAITWTIPQSFAIAYNFNTIAINTAGDRMIAVAEGGGIVQSADGLTWTPIQNLITTTNLTDIIYDSTNTFSFYIVGDAGTVLIYDIDPLSVTFNQLLSPTLTQLPPDLSLLATGEISGRLAFESTDSVVDAGTTKTYTVNIQAYYTNFPEINSIKSFTLTTLQQFYLPYDNVYIRALPSKNDRAKLSELLYNDDIIPNELVYRSDDPYFGKATSVVYQHIYGVPSVAADDFFQTYIDAVEINHYWRNITLGEIKTAQARDANNNVIYEVVYSEVVDDLVNAGGTSIAKSIVWPRNIDLHLNDWVTSLTEVYTSQTYVVGPQIIKTYQSSGDGLTLTLNSVEGLELGMNMLALVNTTVTNAANGTPPVIVAIDTALSTITVNVAQTLAVDQQVLFSPSLYDSLTPGFARTLYPNSLVNMRQQIYDSIGRINDSNLLPRWMTTVQDNRTLLGFTAAWVICYCKPGTAETIKNNILNKYPYTLNEIDFQLDRFEVNRSKTYNYLGTTGGGVPIWNTLPSAQPNVINDDADSFIYFPRKTILPTQTQG